MAGIALILFGPRVFPDPLRYVLLFVLAILTLGAAYRSQEIIIAGFLVTFCALSALGQVGRRHAIATAITIAASVIAIAAIDVSLPLASTDRIFEIGGSRVDVLISRDQPLATRARPVFGKQGDIGRLLEMQFALAKFLESPVVGKGLAYPVPSSLIFHGREPELARLEAAHGKRLTSVAQAYGKVVWA